MLLPRPVLAPAACVQNLPSCTHIGCTAMGQQYASSLQPYVPRWPPPTWRWGSYPPAARRTPTCPPTSPLGTEGGCRCRVARALSRNPNPDPDPKPEPEPNPSQVARASPRNPNFDPDLTLTVTLPLTLALTLTRWCEPHQGDPGGIRLRHTGKQSHVVSSRRRS